MEDFIRYARDPKACRQTDHDQQLSSYTRDVYDEDSDADTPRTRNVAAEKAQLIKRVKTCRKILLVLLILLVGYLNFDLMAVFSTIYYLSIPCVAIVVGHTFFCKHDLLSFKGFVDSMKELKRLPVTFWKATCQLFSSAWDFFF